MRGIPSSGGRVVRRFFREFVAPYWALQVEIAFCLVVGVGLTLVDPLLLRVIIDRALADGDAGLLLLLVAILAGSLVFRIAFRLITIWLYSYSGLRILFDVRRRAFEHLQRLSPYFFRGERFGDILARLTNDVDVLQRAAAHTLVNALQDVLTIAAILATLVWLDAELTLWLVLVYPLLLFLLVRLNVHVRKASLRAREAVGDLYAFLEERIGGVRLIQEHRAERREAAKHVRVSRPWIESNLRLSVLGAFQVSIADLMASGAFILVFLLGGLRVMDGGLTVGSLVAFYTLATRLYRPLTGLVDVNVDLQTARASLERVYGFLDLEPDLTDAPDAAPRPALRGDVRLDGVGLNWRSGQRVLHDVRLAAEAGQRIAIVGPSGSGKSTLAALIARYLDTGTGAVELDGADVRSWRLRDLRRSIGLVPQEALFFHDTVAANLRLARPRAGDEELREVLRTAELERFLATRAEGLETRVGEQGLELSGGERQRLALARALLEDPDLLILDEATSALDPRTEREVLARVFERMAGRTVFVIAHRLWSVQDADRIWVLDEGRVVETGTHAALLERRGLYRRLWDDQGGAAASA